LVPEFIKNQPWNLRPMSAAAHQRLHKLDPVTRTILGAPSYAQGIAAGTGIALAGGNNACD
jgi:hypothetical protein